jgi:hypothetical protein
MFHLFHVFLLSPSLYLISSFSVFYFLLFTIQLMPHRDATRLTAGVLCSDVLCVVCRDSAVLTGRGPNKCHVDVDVTVDLNIRQ